MKTQIRNFTIILFFTLLFFACKSSETENFLVKKGDFKAGITETGELQAIQKKVIPMPFIGWKYGWRFKIVSLPEHGEKVRKDDVIVEIDNSGVIKALEEEETKLELEKANLKKLFASHESQLSQLKSEIQSEKANRDLIALQLEKFSFESDRKKQLKSLELEIADIKLKNIENKLKNKLVVFSNENEIQKIKIEQIEKNIAEAKIALSKLKITSPVTGIAQLERNRRSRRMVQLGDEIHQGQNITSIPDMSKMKVAASINEADIGKLVVGQKAVIRLDAYPEKAFDGEIHYIGKLSREKDEDSHVKVFDFEVLILESDEALKPGMTVSCEVILNELKDAFYVENECVFHDSTGYFILTKSSKEKIPIDRIAVNNTYTAISGKVNKGMKLICTQEYTNQLNE